MDLDKLDDTMKALQILSSAKNHAMVNVIDTVHALEGSVFGALEAYRFVANAFDHLRRESRVLMGLPARSAEAY